MNLKKELSICNANRWQRESKTTKFLFTSSSSHRKSFHLVRLEHHEEGNQVQNRKNRHGKNTQQQKNQSQLPDQKKLLPREPKGYLSMTSETQSVIFGKSCHKTLIRVRVPPQIGRKIDIGIQRPRGMVLISSKVLSMIIKPKQKR